MNCRYSMTFLLFGGCAIFLLGAQTPAPPGPETVVLRLGGKPITRAEFDRWGELIVKDYRWEDAGSRMAVLASVGRPVSLGVEARRRGIDKDPRIAADIEYRANQLLANGLFASIQQELSKDEAATRKFYETRKEQYAEPKVRQILIGYDGGKTKPRAGRGPRTEAQASQRVQALHKRLLAGEDFAKIAASESDDAATAGKGGDMGHIRRGQTVSQFEEAAYATPVGQTSQPFKSEFGYHIVRVDGKLYQPFEGMRRMMEYERARLVVDDMLKKLIQPDPAYFPTAPPVAPPAAPAR